MVRLATVGAVCSTTGTLFRCQQRAGSRSTRVPGPGPPALALGGPRPQTRVLGTGALRKHLMTVPAPFSGKVHVNSKTGGFSVVWHFIPLIMDFLHTESKSRLVKNCTFPIFSLEDIMTLLGKD